MNHRTPRLALLLALVVSLGCATGTVQTTEGPRSAGHVQATDNVADILHVLNVGYEAARVKHDTTPICGTASAGTGPCDDAVYHALHRSKLKVWAASLRTANAGVQTWKKTGAAVPDATAFCPLATAWPDVAQVAIELHAIDSTDLDKWKPIINAVAGAACGGVH